jgi:ribonuclease Z
MDAVTWKYKNLLVQGNSLAGVRTAITLPQHSVAFDVANGLPHVLSMKKYFISHGHMDHAAGVPYIISQKSLQNIKGTQFYMPEELVEPLSEIIKLWGKIEGHQYNFEFIGLNKNDEVKLNDSFFVKAFKTTHRVPSLGYTLFEQKKKLKPEFRNTIKNELIQLKKNNIAIENTEQKPIFSFTGDTTVDVFQECSWLLNSQVLFIEVTYLDERKSIEHSRKWGHIHLDELLPIVAQAKCEKIVFIHASSRYSPRELTNIFNNRIPDDLKPKVEIFLGR